jgi:hypothetical protein
MSMLTFEILAKNPPKLQTLDPDGDTSSDFWESLYHLFKARMEQEQSQPPERG